MMDDERKELQDPCDQEQMVVPLTDALPCEVAAAAVSYLEEKRGRDVKLLDMAGKTDLCDFLILATATSSTHVQALSGALERYLRQRGVSPLHAEGRDNKTWCVLDYGSVLVHMMTRETRDFYQMDRRFES